MEMLTDKIKAFLRVETYDGSGDGYGFGPGSGFGYGDGDGFSYGCGDGIQEFCGEPVYMIDGIPTILLSIHGNAAKGKILNSDFTTVDCFVVKQENLFAHGKTMREAMDALQGKLFEDMPEEERIAAFIRCHDHTTRYPGSDLYDWHHRLTGSCEMGRKAFAKAHGIDIDKDSFTVREFIELTKDSYGGAVIRQLEEAYGGWETDGMQKLS